MGVQASRTEPRQGVAEVTDKNDSIVFCRESLASFVHAIVDKRPERIRGLVHAIINGTEAELRHECRQLGVELDTVVLVPDLDAK